MQLSMEESPSNLIMMRIKRGRAVSGVLVLNKDQGMTSNFALQKVKRIFNARKAGHTGSLDPLATGVLPICFGEATKFSSFFLNASKKYHATIVLGIETDTYDSEGIVVKKTVSRDVSESHVQNVINKFEGELLQIPPMYSALKYKGKPLYKLARKGINMERSPRNVSIYEIELLQFREKEHVEIDIFVHVSKGTYIRSLAHDIGKALGYGAHISSLHRTGAGKFMENDSYKIDDIEIIKESGGLESLDTKLLSLENVMREDDLVEVTSEMGISFCLGQSVNVKENFRKDQEGDIVRVFDDKGTFLGTGCCQENGIISPKRVVCVD